MLDDTLKAQLKAYMENIRHPIELIAALDDRKASQDLEELLQEITALSDKVSWTRGEDALCRYPAGPRIHFAGAGPAACWRTPAQGGRCHNRADQGARR